MDKEATCAHVEGLKGGLRVICKNMFFLHGLLVTAKCQGTNPPFFFSGRLIISRRGELFFQNLWVRLENDKPFRHPF